MCTTDAGLSLMLHLKLMFQITFLQLLKVGKMYVNVRLCIDHLVLIHCSVLTLGRAALLQAMVNLTWFTSWDTLWFFSDSTLSTYIVKVYLSSSLHYYCFWFKLPFYTQFLESWRRVSAEEISMIVPALPKGYVYLLYLTHKKYSPVLTFTIYAT